ncbi:MAG: hypothetical protein ACEPOV_14775 [Hyphomicrobiales bacterium]
MNNPIRFIDPDGRSIDWYESKSGSVLWKKGNAPVVTSNGEEFNNIGSTYTHISGNVSTTYNQNNAISTSITTNTLSNSDWESQAYFKDGKIKWDGCKRTSDKMLSKAGVSSTRSNEILMTNHDANGVVTTATNNVNTGIEVVDNALDSGEPIIIGVDWKSKQTHNKGKYGDKMTDHFIVIMGKTETFNGSGQKTSTEYRFFEPGTQNRTKGTSLNNTLKRVDDFLQGKNYRSRKYKTTVIRRNAN